MISPLDLFFVFILCQTILNLYLLFKLWTIEDEKKVVEFNIKDLQDGELHIIK